MKVLSIYFRINRVSTSLGGDSLPVQQKKLEFRPRRQLGAHLPGVLHRSDSRRFIRGLDFFLMFFTSEVIRTLCDNTNKYAWTHIFEKPSYAERDGSWKEVTDSEMTKFIGLLIYMGIVELPRLHLYWSVSNMFSGLVPSKIMSRNRFFALLAMLHVSDPDRETHASGGKLHKVSWLLKHINDTSASFFQPHRDLSVDERMVKSKGRSGIRQYLRDKITKWGYKLWVLADSTTGYTVQFSVYTGKRESPSPNGLAFDVVTQLCQAYLDQGYIIYMDNFYTSTSLFLHLLERKTLACGTTRKDRRGFPSALKDTSWEKKAKRGDVRWLREKNVLYIQWKDRKVVHLMSTAHTANKRTLAIRKVKSGNTWTQVTIQRPQLVGDYNAGMLGVDKSDQLIGSYNILIKSVRWWKTLFFHCVDIAVVNSYILFNEQCKQHTDIAELKRNARFDQLAFRIELAQQLLELSDGEVNRSDSAAEVPQHEPERHNKRRNCKKCYTDRKVEMRTNVFCKRCGIYLCFTNARNCFTEWHDSQQG